MTGIAAVPMSLLAQGSEGGGAARTAAASARARESHSPAPVAAPAAVPTNAVVLRIPKLPSSRKPP